MSRLIKLAVRRRLPLVVYLYLVNYGRTKADSIHHAISGFLSVSTTQPLPMSDVELD
jgi:hypothetical protein